MIARVSTAALEGISALEVMVETGLFKIALRRSGNIKSTAAAFLGIHRNTFTDKMTKLGLDSEEKDSLS